MSNQKITITYTLEAQKQLPKYAKLFQDKIEESIKDEKYVFGDEVIEVTAADLQKAFDRLHFYAPREKAARRERMQKIITRLYIFVGILITLLGALFPFLEVIVRSQPERAAIILSGVITALIGVIFNLIPAKRNEKERQSMIISSSNSFEDLDNGIRIGK